MHIPLVDLKAQYHSIKPQIDEAIQKVIEDTAFIKGKYVSNFEEEYKTKYSVKHCISVANGTDAIYIVLKMLGIGVGHEVITVANTWISTSETISQTGATPVFVDTEPDYFSIDPDLIVEKINVRTRAIILVHLYGQPADVEKIREICRKRKLLLIEDCAQAHFAEFNGKKVGTFGLAATFSFFPGKNLGAFGDAGAIITNDDDLAEKCRRFANHGSLKKHEHSMEGINSRMDGIQAAILNVKLPYIDSWNESRMKNALYYNQCLADVEQVHVPKIRKNVKHIFHVYCLRVKNRTSLSAFLNENGVETSIHYPTALPFLPAYSFLYYGPNDFPVAFKYQDEIFSLPMYPELTHDQIDFIVEKIKEFYSTDDK